MCHSACKEEKKWAKVKWKEKKLNKNPEKNISNPTTMGKPAKGRC
jgi:hypothetical protein